MKNALRAKQMTDNPLLLKLEFLSIFRLVREKYTLKELSQILHIDIPTLSKYANAQSFPSIKKIKKLLPRLRELADPYREIQHSLTTGSFSFPELNNLLNTRPYLLNWIIVQLIRMMSDKKFNTILSVEGGGLAIGGFIASFLNKKLVYGLRDVYLEGGIIEPYTPPVPFDGSPKLRKYITLPKNVLGRDDRVIILDDISWSGGTIYTLYKLVQKAKAHVEGICLIAVFDDTYNIIRSKINTKINTLFVIPRHG